MKSSCSFHRSPHLAISPHVWPYLPTYFHNDKGITINHLRWSFPLILTLEQMKSFCNHSSHLSACIHSDIFVHQLSASVNPNRIEPRVGGLAFGPFNSLKPGKYFMPRRVLRRHGHCHHGNNISSSVNQWRQAASPAVVLKSLGQSGQNHQSPQISG